MKFRLRRGKHQTGNAKDGYKNYASRHPRTGELRYGVVGTEPGTRNPTMGELPDVVESNHDLVKLFGENKFQRLHDNSETNDDSSNTTRRSKRATATGVE